MYYRAGDVNEDKHKSQMYVYVFTGAAGSSSVSTTTTMLNEAPLPSLGYCCTSLERGA